MTESGANAMSQDRIAGAHRRDEEPSGFLLAVALCVSAGLWTIGYLLTGLLL